MSFRCCLWCLKKLFPEGRFVGWIDGCLKKIFPEGQLVRPCEAACAKTRPRSSRFAGLRVRSGE